VLPGKWEFRSGHPTPSMCFYYFTQGLNPATGLPGTTWPCMPATFLVRATVESAKGDVFALSRRRAVPFVLARAKTTMAELQELTHRLVAKLEPPEQPDVGCEMKTSSLRPLSTVTD
jgi:hypothetical protein